jgi:hypothetical protein
MNAVLARIRREPAAFIGLVASVLMLFSGDVSIVDAVPAAAGLVTRFFVSPA